MYKCQKELDNADGDLGVAPVTANNAHDDTKAATEKVSLFKTDNVANIGRRLKEVGGLNQQLRPQIVSAAVG